MTFPLKFPNKKKIDFSEIFQSSKVKDFSFSHSFPPISLLLKGFIDFFFSGFKHFVDLYKSLMSYQMYFGEILIFSVVL